MAGHGGAGLLPRAAAEPDLTAPDVAAARVPLLRLERLTPSIMIALFAGVPALVWCEEPHHGVQFGIQVFVGVPSILRRQPTGEAEQSGATIRVPFRAGGQRVIHLAGLRDRLVAAEATDPQLAPQKGSGSFAVELLDPPWRQRFQGRRHPPGDRLAGVRRSGARGRTSDRGVHHDPAADRPARDGGLAVIARNDFIAAAAAHGITPRVVGSWLPSLARWPRVLVPVQVDALVLRPGTQEVWADCRMSPPPDGTTSGSPADARGLLPPPFKELDPGLRPPGVYLHWALPDALTAGSQSYDPSQPDAARTTQFPAIPDRWLVVRIGPDAASGRRSVTGWVIQAESDTPVVTLLDQYQGAPRDSSTHGRLTALGHGDPAWAAYYDNVVNRLAFYDPLAADTPAGAVAYLVCGWYSDPADDPLAASQTPTLAAFEARVKALGWQLDTSALDAAANASRDHVSAAASYGLPTPLLGTALDPGSPGCSWTPRPSR